jgi:hypothetical protein
MYVRRRAKCVVFNLIITGSISCEPVALELEMLDSVLITSLSQTGRRKML